MPKLKNIKRDILSNFQTMCLDYLLNANCFLMNANENLIKYRFL